MKRITLTVLVFAASVGWANRLRAGDDLKAEFKQYYERNGYPKSWAAATNDLGAADEKKWQPAAEKLLAVLEQSKADETDGTSPWRATPFWGRWPVIFSVQSGRRISPAATEVRSSSS